MAIYHEKRLVPYRVDQVYRLVSDVEQYPQFLPWCLEVRLRERSPTRVIAELDVGYRLIRESFTSQVDLTSNKRIDVLYIKGPFRSLKTHWIFDSTPKGCQIDFRVEFTFRSKFLEGVTSLLLRKVIYTMVEAFERRAHQLYGPSEPSKAFGIYSGQRRDPKKRTSKRIV